MVRFSLRNLPASRLFFMSKSRRQGLEQVSFCLPVNLLPHIRHDMVHSISPGCVPGVRVSVIVGLALRASADSVAVLRL